MTRYNTRPAHYYDSLKIDFPAAPLTVEHILSLEDIHSLGLEEAPNSYGLGLEEEEAARDAAAGYECRSRDDE